METLGILFFGYAIVFGFLLLVCALMGLRMVLGQLLGWILVNVRDIMRRRQQQRLNVRGGFLVDDNYPLHPKS
ncbi:MAG: hypothetical protein JO316_10650 [Abitibacteriaceae bacterium]|nr:hypothetical protein [Abditibacteriaceae bacterium]MBV9865802.1 hypothetical protein [Abditibacteriaceae bacterium]